MHDLKAPVCQLVNENVAAKHLGHMTYIGYKLVNTRSRKSVKNALVRLHFEAADGLVTDFLSWAFEILLGFLLYGKTLFTVEPDTQELWIQIPEFSVI